MSIELRMEGDLTNNPTPLVTVGLRYHSSESISVTFNRHPVLFINTRGQVTRGRVPPELRDSLRLDKGQYLPVFTGQDKTDGN